MEDSADNYARGYYTEGRKHINKVTDQLRKIIEGCESIQVDEYYTCTRRFAHSTKNLEL
jgi:hypothetical protein